MASQCGMEIWAAAQDHSGGKRSMRWHEMTPRAKDHFYGLETRAYFDGLG
jgi:hypothetical protein